MNVQTVGPVPLHGMVFDVAGVSEQGPRKENQDAFSVETFTERGFVAVADGMGGQRGGRVAAETALSALRDEGEITSLDGARYAVRAADEAVARAADEHRDEREGMGCALALLALSVDRHRNAGWVGAHVGDVRILSRAPDGTVRLETRDHTPAFARWEAGEIGLDEVPDSPGANRLQRAVGRGGEADATWIPARPGWAYILVSDGVTKAMRVDELGDAMALRSAEEVVRAIERKVRERGPDDNYTAVAVRVLPGDPDVGTLPAPAPSAAAAPARPPAGAEARNVFNPPDDVKRTRSSSWGPIAAVLSLGALALAGFALWMALQARDVAEAQRAAVADLDDRVTDVHARMTVPPDTVAPGPEVVPGAPAPGQPPLRQPPPGGQQTVPQGEAEQQPAPIQRP